jgi:peptidoglycan-associated lipoprotein
MTYSTLFALSLAACGGDPPLPKTPEKPVTTAETATTAPPPGASATGVSPEDTSSTVHIDNEILRACGIPEPEAFFGYNAASVRKEDAAPLDKVATCFLTGPLKGRSLRLVGHADPRGSAEYNMLLGHKRADAIGSYLRAKGMTKEKTETTSRGAMDAKGADEATYAKDRRVDILLGQSSTP